MTMLAVVLITKNQAWNITRLIDSVLEETTGISPLQIVLVDSASLDDTVILASRYPIGILRLQADQPLTPAAGRYTGCKHVAGDYVLFLDGDMELYPGWLQKALRLMEEQPDVAVVTGQLVEVARTAKPNSSLSVEKTDEDRVTEIPYSFGAAIYRYSALKQVGSFNPYLCSDEEPELCLRIRQAGYRVLRLEYPIAYHYSSPSQALSTLFGRWRRNLYLGAGQNIRYHVGDGLFWPYFRARGYGCVPGLGLIAGQIAFFWSLKTQQWSWFGIWALLLGFIVAGDAYRKRSLRRTTFSLLHRLFIVDGTVRGFLSKPLHPESYPGRLDIIKPVR